MKKLTLVILFFISTSILFAQNMSDSLYQAVVKGDTTAINDFVNKGTNVNFIKQQGWMKVSLLITAVNNKNTDVVKVILQNGADVNWEDGFNTTALMYAASSGSIDIVKLLLDKGADIRHKDKQGNDAISAAKTGKHKDVVKLLEAKMNENKNLLLIAMTPKCYEILRVSELAVYLKSDSRDIWKFDTCMETNGAFVYYLKSGRVVLLPNHRLDDSKGIVFADKKCFSEYVEKDNFPIDNDKPAIEEIYQQDILEINKNADGIIKHLLLITGSSNNSIPIDISSFSQLLKDLKIKSNKLSKKDLFFSALALGEYLRRVNNGNWILLKQYGTFNPYFTPAIIYPDNSIVLFWDYLISFFKNSTITPEIYANLPYIKSPGLKFDSNVFKHNSFGYQILPNN